jgi:hypothetical protein
MRYERSQVCFHSHCRLVRLHPSKKLKLHFCAKNDDQVDTVARKILEQV